MSQKKFTFTQKVLALLFGICLGVIGVQILLRLYGSHPNLNSSQNSWPSHWTHSMTLFPALGTSRSPSNSILRVAGKNRSDSRLPGSDSPAHLASDREKGRRNQEYAWEKFRERFGVDLRAEFAPSGNLIRVSGAIGQGKRSNLEFHPKNIGDATQRALDILTLANDLIGAQSHLPLRTSGVNPGPISAQLYFSETYQGIPLSPGGQVRIDLGQNGELLTMDSSYVPELQLANEIKLSWADARMQAQHVISSMETENPDESQPIQNERQIIWVKGKLGLHAYEILIGGRKIVIDAGTGRILHTRDHRNHSI